MILLHQFEEEVKLTKTGFFISFKATITRRRRRRRLRRKNELTKINRWWWSLVPQLTPPPLHMHQYKPRESPNLSFFLSFYLSFILSFYISFSLFLYASFFLPKSFSVSLLCLSFSLSQLFDQFWWQVQN